MSIKIAAFGRKAPDGMANDLRELADKVDRGDVTDMIAIFVDRGGYESWFNASKLECIAMASMLQFRCIERMRE